MAAVKLHGDLSDVQFLSLLRKSGAHKERSENTHRTEHAPRLQRMSPKQIHCLLLGDSMLERMKNTGGHTVLGKSSLPRVFNAGVGGDRIRNVVFRLGAMNLFSELQVHGLQFAVLQMGTNDLRSNRALNAASLDEYTLVLEAIHRIDPKVKVLVTGLMPRKDIAQQLVARSNSGLEQLVAGYNRETGTESVFYMPPHPRINISHLVDHVHLNRSGYTLFAAEICRQLESMESSHRVLKDADS